MAVERTERESAILAKLADDGRLSVSGLASDFGVSEVTIRGHLRTLEQQGMLVRTRGGARPITLQGILQRQQVNVEAKEKIAQAAAELIGDDARHLTSRRGVQIVTNSTLVFNNARVNPALNIILAGGVFRPESESLVGPLAERAIADFNTRIAFLGTDGFSPERGLTTRFVEGAQVATTMRERAEQTWLVADSSKFGQAGFVSFLPLDAITGIITDSGLPDDAVEALKEHTNVRIV